MQGYKNHINKATAVVLLIVLLFIHSIKILHHHTIWHSDTTHKVHVVFCNTGDDSSQFSGSCTICNYHLTKDTDIGFLAGAPFNPVYFSDFNPHIISFKKSASFSSFEIRGPPVHI